MKDLFTGFYRKSEEEIKEFWKDGIIVFDTNVLLNLYRYSDNTRNALLNLISKFAKQIYLPYQAAFEYNKNRFEVIAEQEKAYKEFLEKITQIKKDLQSTINYLNFSRIELLKNMMLKNFHKYLKVEKKDLSLKSHQDLKTKKPKKEIINTVI